MQQQQRVGAIDCESLISPERIADSMVDRVHQAERMSCSSTSRSGGPGVKPVAR